MLAYFVRRWVEGLVALLAMTFVLYALLVYLPSWIIPAGSYLSHWRLVDYYIEPPYLSQLTIDSPHREPWPNNYVTWLFDPRQTWQLANNNFTDYRQMGINVRIGKLSLQGSGILTGDFGRSYHLARGQSTLSLMGPSFWVWNLLIISLALPGMAFVLLQRIGHHPKVVPARFPFTPHDRASLTFRYTRPV
ncbi:MAG: hypothetical protein ABI670_10425 [Chloroflexota bacterium]